MTIDQYGIHLTKKEMSVTASVIVILGLLAFIVGYFWGKQSVIDGFSQKTSQESFNDQVDYLLTMQSFAAKNGGISIVDAQEEDQSADQENVAPVVLEASSAVQAPVQKQESVKTYQNNDPKNKKAKSMHFAALAGFGKKVQAQQMVDRLKKRHIDVILKTRVSKSVSGKSTKTWYQVVTQSFETIQEVQDAIDSILRSEKIKKSDIKIF